MAKAKKQKSEEPEKKETKPKSIGPYDIIKMMFTDINGFDSLSNSMLSRNAFLINRIFSIQFPQQAQCFNNTAVNTADVVKSWRLFAVKSIGFGRVPNFVYTKGARKAEQSKDSQVKIPKDLRDAYCLHAGISIRDYNDLMEIDPAGLQADVQKYDKITSSSEQGKMFAKG